MFEKGLYGGRPSDHAEPLPKPPRDYQKSKVRSFFARVPEVMNSRYVRTLPIDRAQWYVRGCCRRLGIQVVQLQNRPGSKHLCYEMDVLRAGPKSWTIKSLLQWLSGHLKRVRGVSGDPEHGPLVCGIFIELVVLFGFSRRDDLREELHALAKNTGVEFRSVDPRSKGEPW